MPDSSEIENAIVAKLGADATLLALVPNGVYVDQAPAGSTKFVIVHLVDEVDGQSFNSRAFEDALFMVKVVTAFKAGDPATDSKAAAKRIDDLLEGGTLTPVGYSLMTMHRESRIRDIEIDDVDRSIRRQLRGGNYRVVVST